MLRAFEAADLPQPVVRITKVGELVAYPAEATPADGDRTNPSPLEQWRAKRSGQG